MSGGCGKLGSLYINKLGPILSSDNGHTSKSVIKYLSLKLELNAYSSDDIHHNIGL